MITSQEQEQLDNWFTYHAPVGNQVAEYATIRDTAKSLAMVIVDLCPASVDRSAAIRLLRECVMTANSSIACCGK